MKQKLFSLENKTALVCGASQGIGRATAHFLAEQGAEIILLARNAATLEEVLADLPRPLQQKHSYRKADTSQTGHLAEVIEALLWERQHPIHILVNNTGGPASGPLVEAEPQAFRQAFEQHLIAAQYLVQALLPGMKQERYGRIINIISTSVKQPLRGLGVSNTIRAAVANWAKTLSVELGPYGITVNNVLPGATSTQRLQNIMEAKALRTGLSLEAIEAEMQAEIPARRFALPEEIAAAVGFLASEQAAYVNGINLPVDGGRTACL